MFEELMIRHCSPTLAGLKTGNIFTCSFSSMSEINENIRRMNRKLTPKGLRVLPMKRLDSRVLIYVYRPDRLRRDFSRRSVRRILDERGYKQCSPQQCIIKLMERLQQEDFPHEIGLFLGYPPEDVKGFIENGAAYSKCTGYWKVYGDHAAAEKTFAQYRKCTAVYCEQWKKGRAIERLVVADALQ